MKKVSAAKVQANLANYLKDASAEPVVVTQNGRPVAVLMGVTDKEDLERLMLSCSPKLRAILDESRQQIREGKGIPHDEFWAAIERRSARSGTAKKRRRKTA